MTDNKMKTCTICKTTKNESEFSRNKSTKDGINRCCRQCNNERVKAYARTKDGIVTKIYSNQRDNSKKRNHQMPTYSKQELKDWLFSQPKFHILYDNWKRLDYQKGYKPSVDRKNDNIGYTMANIQIMTWGENKAKGHADTRSGKLKHGHKPQKAVLQFTKNGELIAEYISLCEAARRTNLYSGNISSCCLGKRKWAGGFKWVYA